MEYNTLYKFVTTQQEWPLSKTKNSRWYCERYHRNCYSMAVQANKQVSEWSK